MCNLIHHITIFPIQRPGFVNYMKPILQCDVQFHYMNKMEYDLRQRIGYLEMPYKEKII